MYFATDMIVDWMTETEENLLMNPLFRHGVGFAGATIIAVIAFLFLEGVAFWVALGVAAMDALVTPMFLKKAAEAEEESEDEE